MAFGHFFFNKICVQPCVQVRVFSSHGQRLAPSKKNCSGAPWLESNGFWLWGFKRQNFLSWVWLAGHTFSLHRITNWWFLAMRLQGLDFSIQSKAPRTYIFLIRDLFRLMMSSDSEASRARFLYSERGSQDICFPFTNSIRIGDFWLWGFEGQIFLLPAWPSGHTFSLYKAYLNLSFLTLRLQGPDLCILNVAPRMYNFLVQSLSKLVISDSGTSRTRFLYSERG